MTRIDAGRPGAARARAADALSLMLLVGGLLGTVLLCCAMGIGWWWPR